MPKQPKTGNSQNAMNSARTDTKTIQSGTDSLTIVFRVPTLRQALDAYRAGGGAELALLEKLIVSISVNGHTLDDPLDIAVDHIRDVAEAIFNGGAGKAGRQDS